MLDNFGLSVGGISLATIVDAVIALTVFECFALMAYRAHTGRGVAVRDFAINMVSGLCLMLALRSQVRESGIEWVMLFMLAAGIAHGCDILMRWKRARRGAAAGIEYRRVAP